MTVTGETEFERQRREIACSFGKSFERSAQTKLREITMNRNAGLLLEYAREVKWRSVYGPRHLIERDAFTHPRRQVRLRSFSTFRVIRIRPFSFRLALDSSMYKRRLEHVSDQL